MPIPTPQEVFDYAIAFTNERVQSNAHRLQPNFREAARKFRCKISDLEDVIQDYQGAGYLGYAVGFQCGGGAAPFKNKGDYLIEAERP